MSSPLPVSGNLAHLAYTLTHLISSASITSALVTSACHVQPEFLQLHHQWHVHEGSCLSFFIWCKVELLTAHTCACMLHDTRANKRLTCHDKNFVYALQALPAAACGSTTLSAQQRVNVTATAHRHPGSNAAAVTLGGISSGLRCGVFALLLWVWALDVCQLPLALQLLCSVLLWSACLLHQRWSAEECKCT